MRSKPVRTPPSIQRKPIKGRDSSASRFRRAAQSSSRDLARVRFRTICGAGGTSYTVQVLSCSHCSSREEAGTSSIEIRGGWPDYPCFLQPMTDHPQIAHFDVCNKPPRLSRQNAANFEQSDFWSKLLQGTATMPHLPDSLQMSPFWHRCYLPRLNLAAASQPASLSSSAERTTGGRSSAARSGAKSMGFADSAVERRA